MLQDKYKIRLRKSKEKGNLNLPQFSLSYSVRKGNPGDISYEILSALKGHNDVIVELNSALLQNVLPQRQGSFSHFYENIVALGLVHQYQSSQADQKLSILGFPIEGRKKTEIQNISVYVPNDVWQKEFQKILPVAGARYYVLKSPSEQEKAVNSLCILSDEEKAEAFELVLFDLAVMGQMGIQTRRLDMVAIRNRLSHP